MTSTKEIISVCCPYVTNIINCSENSNKLETI